MFFRKKKVRRKEAEERKKERKSNQKENEINEKEKFFFEKRGGRAAERNFYFHIFTSSSNEWSLGFSNRDEVEASLAPLSLLLVLRSGCCRCWCRLAGLSSPFSPEFLSSSSSAMSSPEKPKLNDIFPALLFSFLASAYFKKTRLFGQLKLGTLDQRRYCFSFGFVFQKLKIKIVYMN